MLPAIMAIISALQQNQNKQNESLGNIKAPNLGSGFQMAKPTIGSTANTGGLGTAMNVASMFTGGEPEEPSSQAGPGTMATGAGGTSGFVNAPQSVDSTGGWLNKLLRR